LKEMVDEPGFRNFDNRQGPASFCGYGRSYSQFLDLNGHREHILF
jgi:hypothetical protein